MKRSLFLLGVASAFAPAGAEPAAGSRVRIGVLGDSLALGTGASRADGGFIFRSFRVLLSARPGSRIDNFAIGGATVADVTRLQVSRLANTEYDIVVVCVGGNDVVHGTKPIVFRNRYSMLLERIAAKTPRAHIICCGIPDVSISPIFANERDHIRLMAVRDDQAVRSGAESSGAAFADLFTTGQKTSDAARFLSRDRFHPSDAGYVLLAGALTPVLLRAIARA